MAAAAVAAQDEEVHSQGGPLPVTRFLQPETSLAGFFGHVQIGFARAIDKQGWERLEQHLENVRRSLFTFLLSWPFLLTLSAHDWQYEPRVCLLPALQTD